MSSAQLAMAKHVLLFTLGKIRINSMTLNEAKDKVGMNCTQILLNSKLEKGARISPRKKTLAFWLCSMDVMQWVGILLLMYADKLRMGRATC